ncbi:MAG TPA: hypothetical protein VMP01_00260, partial [Pirellulaceae bacterium]|nr:hypothetical protein [Pirellulaceae bacterium]
PATRPLRDWHQSDKPSRQDAAITFAGSAPQLANANRQAFHFPLNQDSLALDMLSMRFTQMGRQY